MKTDLYADQHNKLVIDKMSDPITEIDARAEFSTLASVNGVGGETMLSNA